MTPSLSYLNTKAYALKRLLSYMQGQRKAYLLGTLYSILNKLFDIMPEILIGAAVDIVVNGTGSLFGRLLGITSLSKQLMVLGAFTFFVWVLESFFQFLYSVKWRSLAQLVEHRLRVEAYDHIQKARVPDIEAMSSGALISTLNDDVNQLERFLEDGVNKLIQIMASTVLIGGVFLSVSPLITLFAVVPVPFILLTAFYFQHKLEPLFLNVRAKAARIGATLNDSFSRLSTIKMYTAEDYESRRLVEVSEDYQNANKATIKISSKVTPYVRMGILTGFLFTLGIGAHDTMAGHMNVGVFSVLVFLSQRLLWPFRDLAEVVVNYQRAMASTTRVLDLLTWPLEDYVSGAVPTVKGAGEIRFEHVCFSYPQKGPLFEDFSLTIPPKARVAFVGESGSGKSSLVKLLCRFYPPDSGKVLYNSQDIQGFSQTWWRQQMSLVSQDVFIFHGTIRDNIRYGCLGVEHTDEALMDAARRGGAESFILSLPQGLDSQVGEKGHELSGGQRQRIAIARAVLKDSPLLIMDEATSAVDNETELLIQRAIHDIGRDKTTLLIAHRLSTVRHVDKIYVLDQGRIVEEGNHDTLLAQEGRYAALWRIQTGETEKDVESC